MQKWSSFSGFGLRPRAIVGMLIMTALLAGAYGPTLAHAADGTPSFALQPVLYDPSNPVTQSYFVFDSRPGTILHNRLRLTNSGTATGTALLYGVDATTGQTSGAVYLSHKAVQRDVGTWITLGIKQITLAPGQSQIVPFQVVIPGVIRPGQHLGGIVAENMTLSSSSQGSLLHINVQNLTIIAVQINLPSTQLEQLVAAGIEPGGANNYQTLLLGLSNTGTVMLKPSGTLQVTDTQGHLLQSIPLTLDTFLPGTAIAYPAYIRGQALGVGEYQAILDLQYGHDHLLHYTTVFTITQQQLTQVFKSMTPPQPPWLWGSFTALPLWLIFLFALLLGGNVLYWGQKLYRLLAISRLRNKKKA